MKEYENYYKLKDDMDKSMIYASRFCFILFAWFMTCFFYIMGISEIDKFIPFYLLGSVLVFIAWFTIADKPTKLSVLRVFTISLIGGLLWVPYYGFYYPLISFYKYWTFLPD